MKERSAVTGEVIKMKIKKTSRDKEVRSNTTGIWLSVIHIAIGCVYVVISQLVVSYTLGLYVE